MSRDLRIQHQSHRPLDNGAPGRWAKEQGLAFVFINNPWTVLLGGIRDDATDDEVVGAFAYAVNPRPLALTTVNVARVDDTVRQIQVAWDHPIVQEALGIHGGSRKSLILAELATSKERTRLDSLSNIVQRAEDELRMAEAPVDMADLYFAEALWKRMNELRLALPDNEEVRAGHAEFLRVYSLLLQEHPRGRSLGVTHDALKG